MERAPQTNWRRILKARWFHALWIGAALAALVITYDGVWLWVMGVMLVAFVLLAIEWFHSLMKPDARRRRRSGD